MTLSAVTPRLLLMLVLSCMVFDTTRGRYCKISAITDCFPLFASYVGWGFDVIRMNDSQFEELCTDFREHGKQCMQEHTSSCESPPELTGFLPAFTFLCDTPSSSSPEFKSHRECYFNMPKLKCTEMYPQVMPMAARHILNRALDVLDMGYSSDKESSLYSSTCIHLSTSRDIFCADFYVLRKCGQAAATWLSTFRLLLFKMTIDSLSTVTVRGRKNVLTLDAVECPFTGNFDFVDECLLVKQCIPNLNNFARNVRFGVFTFSEADLQSFCRYPQSAFEKCLSEITNHCSLVDVLIYNGSLKVHEKLCSAANKDPYKGHSSCYQEVSHKKEYDLVPICTDPLMQQFKTTSEKALSNSDVAEKDMETALCVAVSQYLICIEEKLTAKCGADAAKLQRKLTRYMIVQAFQWTHCSSTFDFLDMDASVEGRGQRVKVNELTTALLVATAAVVTCYNCIKRLH